MKIDEEKQYGLHKLEKNTATNENKKIYSDHNSILIYLDFETPTEEQRPKKIITQKGYKRYRAIIEEKNVSKLLKTGELQQIGHNNRDFNKICIKNKNKKPQGKILKSCIKIAKD